MGICTNCGAELNGENTICTSCNFDPSGLSVAEGSEPKNTNNELDMSFLKEIKINADQNEFTKGDQSYNFIKVVFLIVAIISFLAYFILLAIDDSWMRAGNYSDQLYYAGSVVNSIVKNAKADAIKNTLKIVFLISGLYHAILLTVMLIIKRNINKKSKYNDEKGNEK